MTNERNIAFTILGVSLLIVIASVVYSNYLAGKLAHEEQRRIGIWAEATRQLIMADENTDIDFVSSIIEGNNTIPVYMVDKEGNILLTRNVKHPVKDPTTLSEPIEVRISSDIVQYIYYDQSTLLKQLRYFPYIQFALIFIFIVVGVLTLISVQKSEQDRVWVGLSKETAHQLGTPISSLNGWLTLIEDRYPNDELIPQIRADVDRLNTIADRFSKVGSDPDLKETELVPVVEHVISYMHTRISKKVDIQIIDVTHGAKVKMNVPLFSWVMENLIKNAVDAMDGIGKITIHLFSDADFHYIDISDTGKGIEKNRQNRIFEPGYTTKKRGWGLGLSLCRRIINKYHHGKIFVLRSAPQEGATFRIKLWAI